MARRRRPHSVPLIERLQVRNYRALRDLDLRDLTPLTVFLGPNGSGKSTIFDVFAFLSECFTAGVRKAWDKRGRFKELRSRGASGPIEFEVWYVEPGFTPTVYKLAIDEGPKGPFVAAESIRWTRSKSGGNNFKFLDFVNGEGYVIEGERPDKGDTKSIQKLASPEVLAVNTLGQLRSYPRVVALREFISDWYLSNLTTTVWGARNTPEGGLQEKLSQTADNLANVVRYLSERHPDRLEEILCALRERVPWLERVETEPLSDGRLLLKVKDTPFPEAFPAGFASDGTLKLLAHLIVLYDPSPPPLIGIEEPENFLHPRLIAGVADAIRKAASDSQLIVTTHSPFFVDSLRSGELRVLYRRADGFTNVRGISDMPNVMAFVKEGASLGHLWVENHFDVGDPLAVESRSAKSPRRK